MRVAARLGFLLVGLAAPVSAAAERDRHGHQNSHAVARGETPAAAQANQQTDSQGGDHELETENLFGFISGSDVEHAGARGLAIETVVRTGKGPGRYVAAGHKVEFAYGVTDDLSVAGALLGSYHRISAAPDFADVDALRFNGLGGEMRWRLLRRESYGVGVTVQLEPVWARSDELTGLAATKWGLENKFILDAALVPGRLFGAFNLIHEVERVKERGAAETERASKIGFGAALAAPVTDALFVGAEVRQMYAFDGLAFNDSVGRALFAGPTVYARFPGGAWASVAWSAQLTGRANGDPRSHDLQNFERHMVRVKAGFEF